VRSDATIHQRMGWTGKLDLIDASSRAIDKKSKLDYFSISFKYIYSWNQVKFRFESKANKHIMQTRRNSCESKDLKLAFIRSEN